MTGCLRPTPTDDLYALAGIQPFELRRKRATLFLVRRAQDPKHMLHERLLSPLYGGHRQLKSRRSFVPVALDLLNDADALSTCAAGSRADHKWNTEWQECASRLHGFITDVGSLSSGMHLPRPAWVRLNRLRTGVGQFRSTMHKWGMDPSPACECGADEQTADHLIISCPIYRHPNGASGLASDDMTLKDWLLNTCPAEWIGFLKERSSPYEEEDELNWILLISYKKLPNCTVVKKIKCISHLRYEPKRVTSGGEISTAKRLATQLRRNVAAVVTGELLATLCAIWPDRECNTVPPALIAITGWCYAAVEFEIWL